ncbi:MAG: hypothetical protein U0165_15045 [Polyangiaceae bacterium]
MIRRSHLAGVVTVAALFVACSHAEWKPVAVNTIPAAPAPERKMPAPPPKPQTPPPPTATAPASSPPAPSASAAPATSGSSTGRPPQKK